MDKEEKLSKRNEGRGIAAIITIAVSVFALVCCVIPSGGVFSSIRGFFLGVLGVFSYILFASLILISFFYLRGIKIKMAPKKAAMLISIFFALLFAVHVVSTLKQFGESATMAEYLSNVYKAQWTAGGLLTGIIAYAFRALLSVWGSFVLYLGVIAILSLAMLDFSMFKRRERQPQPKQKEVSNFELRPDFVPQEPAASNVGSGLYVSKIQPAAGQDADRRQTAKKGRLYSDIDKKDKPPYAPADARTSAHETLYGFKPAYASGQPGNEPEASVFGSANKPSAYETLFGKARPAKTGVTPSNSVTAGTFGNFSDTKAGDSILHNNYAPNPRPATLARPTKIVHDPAFDTADSPVSSLAPNDIYDSSVTPRPRNNFGIYADNPNPIISGDFYSNKIEAEKFEEKKEEKFKPAGQTPQTPARPAAPPVSGFRASISPDVPKAEPRREFNELDGKFRTGINPKAYESFAFSADRDKEVKEAINEVTGEERTDKIISIYEDEETADDILSRFNEDKKESENLGAAGSALRGLRPDPEIVSERTEDHTGYYEVLPPERERTKIEKFEDKVADLEKAFNDILQPDSALETPFEAPSEPKPREPVIKTSPRGKTLRPDNQVRLIDYGAETANPERREPLLQPIPYTPPMVSLLRTQSTELHDSNVDYEAKKQLLESIMEEFRTPARVIGYTCGPAVTRYELQTAQGVSVKKIEGLAQDIAYNMACRHSVRIQSPIAGRQAVGIEVPNDKIAVVALKELIESREYRESQHPLTFAVGKDVAGKCIVDNLVNMIHVLVAGSTGSGKSACLNSLIASIIFKSSPDDVRLILIDPKRVEFNIYNGLPHLLLPEAVNEPEKAINAFTWAIEEMERRYKLFQSLKVADIQEYNASPEVQSGQESKLSYIVIVVDELADLMSFNKREMEEKIRRLSALARAAGIHLVIATQRPSVDVITGTIKTNLPSRMAFAVTNFADSKTILDQSGAENLLGRGDMLLCGQNMKEPIRVQGAFITKAEVKAIVQHVKALNPSVYDEEAAKAINYVKAPEESSSSAIDSDEESDDPLLGEAVKLVIENGQASISMVQRRFSVGYARAARLIDQMELRKFISPFEGSKPRQVYITTQEWNEIFGQ